MIEKDNTITGSYSESGIRHILVLIILFCVTVTVIFIVVLPMLEQLFYSFLNGRVYNDGTEVAMSLDAKEPKNATSYLTSWAVDIYLKTPSETRYWFNPLLSMLMPVAFISGIISLCLTMLLPANIGYLRLKFERELAGIIERITFINYGLTTDENKQDVIELLYSINVRQLNEYSQDWNIPLGELQALWYALQWRRSSQISKIININDAIRFYMYSHFTVKYANTVLGLVYIGAAVLIIIVGLRGLKFIPPTQPSLVLFALGLEFTLLMAYALTLMYSKQDEEGESEKRLKRAKLLSESGEFGGQKEVENLIKMFLKNRKN